MNKLIVLGLSILIAGKAFSQKDIIPSVWMDKQINVDGLIADWKQEPSLYDQKTKIFFEIANDSTNIYLLLKIKDQQTQIRVMNSGINLEIIKKEKPKRKAYIKYPIKEDIGESIQMNQGFPEYRGNNGRNQNDPKDFMIKRRESFKLRSELMEIKGFQTEDGTYPVRNSKSIKVAIDWNVENTMFCEVRIPIREYYGDSYAVEYIKTIPLTLKVTLNAVERPNFGPGGERMHPGGGMRPGGGMGPGGVEGGASVRMGMGPGGGRNSATFTSLDFKQKIQLVFE